MRGLRDRIRSYVEFETGTPLPKGDQGLWSFQTDCARWLLPVQEERQFWRPGAAVVCPLSNGDARFGTLVALDPSDTSRRWRVHMTDTDAEEIFESQSLWRPSGAGHPPCVVVGVLIPPGYGKTAVAAFAISRMPRDVSVLYVTASGLLDQTRDELQLRLSRAQRPPLAAWFAVTTANGKRLVEQAGESRSKLVTGRVSVTSYALLQRASHVVLESFDSVFFDEAHVAAPAVGRALSLRSSKWWQPYPRYVIMSGSAHSITRHRWYASHVDESFYLSKSAAAPRCLGMPRVDIAFCRYSSPAFCLRSYILKLVRVEPLDVHDSYLAMVWWSYERRTGIWGRVELAEALILALTRSMAKRLQVSHRRRGFREELLSLLSDGSVAAYNSLAATLRRAETWLEAALEYAGLRLDAANWSTLHRQAMVRLPPPVRFERTLPLSETPTLNASVPDLMRQHRLALGAPDHGDRIRSIIRWVAASLRGRAGEPAPKILMCLADLPYGVAEQLMERMCNYPRRNEWCGAKRDCASADCPQCHLASRFRLRSGKRVIAQPEDRWCLRKLDASEKSGELFEHPGVEAAHVFVMRPHMSERERARLVRHFNSLCELSFRALSALLQQARRNNRLSHPFLGFLNVGNGALGDLLRRFVEVPQLHVAFGGTADLGWNFQRYQSYLVMML